MSRQSGFTLIELVMVIVILGILAATVIPQYADLQNEAKQAAAEGFLAAAQSALTIKYADNLVKNLGGWPTGTELAAEIKGSATTSCTAGKLTNPDIADWQIDLVGIADCTSAVSGPDLLALESI